MATVPKKQLAVRLSLPMAAAAQECAWQADRMRRKPESSGYIQRWLEELIERELREWGFWPPNEKTYAGEAPQSPHTGRIPDAERERRTEARIDRVLQRERVQNGGLTDREYFEQHGHFPGQLPPARTREDFREEDPPPLPEPPVDEARGDEATAGDDENIL